MTESRVSGRYPNQLFILYSPNKLICLSLRYTCVVREPNCDRVNLQCQPEPVHHTLLPRAGVRPFLSTPRVRDGAVGHKSQWCAQHVRPRRRCQPYRFILGARHLRSDLHSTLAGTPTPTIDAAETMAPRGTIRDRAQSVIVSRRIAGPPTWSRASGASQDRTDRVVYGTVVPGRGTPSGWTQVTADSRSTARALVHPGALDTNTPGRLAATGPVETGRYTHAPKVSALGVRRDRPQMSARSLLAPPPFGPLRCGEWADGRLAMARASRSPRPSIVADVRTILGATLRQSVRSVAGAESCTARRRRCQLNQSLRPAAVSLCSLLLPKLAKLLHYC